MANSYIVSMHVKLRRYDGAYEMFTSSTTDKRTELPSRIAVLYGGNMIATAFSGLIAAGSESCLPRHRQRHALLTPDSHIQDEWRRRATILGMALHHRGSHDGGHRPTLAASDAGLSPAEQTLAPPSRPPALRSECFHHAQQVQSLGERSAGLTGETLYVQEWRIRKENAGIVDEDIESVWWGVRQALADPKLYMFVGLLMSLITAESFSNFFPSIVGTLGYDSTTTLLLTSPPYFFAFFVSLGVSFHAAHTHERGWHIAVPMGFALLGNLLVCEPSRGLGKGGGGWRSIENKTLILGPRLCVFFIRPCLSPRPAAATSPCSS